MRIHSRSKTNQIRIIKHIFWTFQALNIWHNSTLRCGSFIFRCIFFNTLCHDNNVKSHRHGESLACRLCARWAAVRLSRLRFDSLPLQTTTEKHRMSFPETVDEILDVSEDEGTAAPPPTPRAPCDLDQSCGVNPPPPLNPLLFPSLYYLSFLLIFCFVVFVFVVVF